MEAKKWLFRAGMTVGIFLAVSTSLLGDETEKEGRLSERIKVVSVREEADDFEVRLSGCSRGEADTLVSVNLSPMGPVFFQNRIVWLEKGDHACRGRAMVEKGGLYQLKLSMNHPAYRYRVTIREHGLPEERQVATGRVHVFAASSLFLHLRKDLARMRRHLEFLKKVFSIVELLRGNRNWKSLTPEERGYLKRFWPFAKEVVFWERTALLSATSHRMGKVPVEWMNYFAVMLEPERAAEGGGGSSGDSSGPSPEEIRKFLEISDASLEKWRREVREIAGGALREAALALVEFMEGCILSALSKDPSVLGRDLEIAIAFWDAVSTTEVEFGNELFGLIRGLRAILDPAKILAAVEPGSDPDFLEKVMELGRQLGVWKEWVVFGRGLAGEVPEGDEEGKVEGFSLCQADNWIGDILSHEEGAFLCE